MTAAQPTASRARPILFSGEMVRAILAGTKTQTRRVIGPDNGAHLPACKYGVPGNQLWVKETHAQFAVGDSSGLVPQCVAYRASCDADGCFDYVKAGGEVVNIKVTKWTPSIYMPRWASRITLEMTDVRVERVQDISAYDAIAEGIPRVSECGCEVCRRSVEMCPADSGEQVQSYMHLWDKINGKREGCSWADNPWVWALSFRRVA